MDRETFEKLEVSQIVIKMYNIDGYTYPQLADVLTDEERAELFGAAFVHHNVKIDEYETGYSTFDNLLNEIADDVYADLIVEIESSIREMLVYFGDKHFEAGDGLEE